MSKRPWVVTYSVSAHDEIGLLWEEEYRTETEARDRYNSASEPGARLTIFEMHTRDSTFWSRMKSFFIYGTGWN